MPLYSIHAVSAVALPPDEEGKVYWIPHKAAEILINI